MAAIIVLVVEIVGVRVAGAHQPGARHLDQLGYALVAIGALALTVRRRFRATSLLITLAATVGYVVLGYPYGPIFLAALISVFSAVRAGYRHWVWPACAVAYLAFVALGHVVSHVGGVPLRTPGIGTAVVVAAWTLVVIAAAEGARVRTERFAEMARTRAEQARTRTEQERRQASEERLQIARELHDVIGHHLSLINVRAGVGLHLMDERPDQARVALEAIKQASAEALGEVRAVLAALRPKDEAAPRAPAPSLANLAALVDPAATEIVGDPVPLPPEVDRAAYRIVQESLTNVRRHAGPEARARVTITYRDDQLLIRTVDNGTAPPASAADSQRGPGDGIAGMRARSEALGGSLEAGRGPDGGFVVTASLPLRPASRAAPADDHPVAGSDAGLANAADEPLATVPETGASTPEATP
jgi:signal transduction histidine kinase